MNRVRRAPILLAFAAMLLAACQTAPAAPQPAARAENPGAAPAAAPVAAQPAPGQPAAAAPAPARELRVGDRAPDFKLPDQNRQEVTLSQFRGRTTQVAFYVWALSPG